MMVSGLISENILPKAIDQFSEIHPGVRLNLRTGTAEEVAMAVARGEVESGLSHALITQPGLVSSEIGTHDYVLLAHPDHPLNSKSEITLEKIASYPLVLGRAEAYDRKVIENLFCEADLQFDAPFEVGGNIAMLKKIVSMGLGLGIVPCIALSESDFRILDVTSLVHLLPLGHVRLLRAGRFELERIATDLIMQLTEVVRTYESEIGVDRRDDISVTSD